MSKQIKKFVVYLFRSIYISGELFVGLFFLLLLYVLFSSHLAIPSVPQVQLAQRKKVSENHYTLGANYLKKNEFGIWEMYIEGDPYQRGLVYGTLAQELHEEQEFFFVQQINLFVPRGFFQNILRLTLGYFACSMPNYIPEEYQQEIFGVSQLSSDKFDYISPKYTRILSYHAAHDIGHALNDYSLVGCTSFAFKNQKTEDNGLLIGRNFDFYVGDDFAKNKLVLFVNPTDGYRFMSYSWPGFMGVVSGMNEHGLTVSINAAKSDLPTSVKTPISLLAREILQYAKSFDQAIEIVKKRNIFVSETLLIGSVHDNGALLIEKSPTKTGLMYMNNDQLICANHYQSETFVHDPINIQNIQNSDSHYRYDRIKELIKDQLNPLTPIDAASLLRDQKGTNNLDIGRGNPRAVNQLLAHHSIIMQPAKRIVYVSTHDYQLGKWIAYDLDKTFEQKKISIVDSLPADPFIKSEEYKQYKQFKKTKTKLTNYLLLNEQLSLSASEIQEFIEQNKNSYLTYELLGKYFYKKKNFTKARYYFEKSLSKHTASKQVDNELKNWIKACQK